MSLTLHILCIYLSCENYEFHQFINVGFLYFLSDYGSYNHTVQVTYWSLLNNSHLEQDGWNEDAVLH